MLKEHLEPLGHIINEVADPQKAISSACSLGYQLIILCLDLPKDAGMRTLRALSEECPEVPVIATADAGSAKACIEAMNIGACRYLLKPIDPEELCVTVTRALEYGALIDSARRLSGEFRGKFGIKNLIGANQAAKTAHDKAANAAKTDHPVILYGEPGTGKAHLARVIHFESDRACSPFVRINCVGEEPDQLEKALFGHEKGTCDEFQGSRTGLLEHAKGGTLLLDGAEEIHSDTQQKILAALREKRFIRLGGSQPAELDIRVIAATSADADTETEGGSFLGILQRQLSAHSIALPPLRNRQEDIPGLVDHLVRKFATETGKTMISGLSDSAMDCIISYEWPGNVRELSNCIERAVIACTESYIQPVHLTLDRLTQQGKKQKTKLRSLREVERDHIKKVLVNCEWNRSAAANILEIDRKTLRSKIREFGFVPPEEE